ncbi:MAG: polysaccharide deacetylase family protein [Clostridia bacterium]|nr:polysaccharide deacetylase family protein [Clostridia bacterium]
MEHIKGKRWFGLCFLFIVTVGIVGFSAWHCFFTAPPRILLNGVEEETLILGNAYMDKGAVVMSGAERLDKALEIIGSVDTGRRGTYTIEYRLQYHGQTISAQRRVKVVDGTPPTMQLNGADRITVSLKSMYHDPGVTVSDNLDGDLSDRVTVTETATAENMYTLLYSVSDNDGNTTQLTRELIVKDVVKPVITVNGESKMAIIEQDKYYDSGATARDDVDGNLSAKITVSGGVDTSRLGTHTITYTVQDSSGNTATAQRTVTVISKSAAQANKIFLTFDDGPSTSVTTRILDILKKNNVKATFFILDYGVAKKPLIQRMLNEGHTIGIHGYSHDFAKIYASDAAFMDNINRLNDKLASDFGHRTNLIRFPGGSSNTVSRKYAKGIMTRLSKLVSDSGYIYYDWNISSNDAVKGMSSKQTIYSSVTENLRYSRNNIVLMHDTAAKTTTADALQDIINYGKNHAYVFEALTDAIPPYHHRIQN